MATATTTTALARVQMPAAPIAKIEDLRDQYALLATQVNLVTPLISPDFIPPMHSVSLRAVLINPGEGAGDVYHSPAFLKPNERALTKIAILKLLQAAGGTVVESRRLDDRRDHYIAEFRVVVEVPQMDGSRRRFEATKSVDYRDGSPQVSAFKPGQLAAARQFVPELAETKALLRAVRGALALKQKYAVDELARPFVVPALVPDVDMSDPEIRRMVAAKALGMADALYGPHPGAPAPTTHQIGDGRERPEPGQVLEAAAVTVLAEKDDAGDTIEEPGAESTPDPALICSGCPCGCQDEASREQATKTRETVKVVRCAACYPWSPSFDVTRHRALGLLNLPSRPQLTGEQAAKASRGR